jgi:NAD+ synthase
MGYFTKWGDGACDFNPVSDLTKTEIFEFLRHLKAPEIFYTKPPSAGLYEGQTDEADMGITYAELDHFLLTGEKGPNYHIIEKYHKTTQHKRN